MNWNTEPLRLGITTGTCAQAVVAACCEMLVCQKVVESVCVELPNGEMLVLSVSNQIFTEKEASCSIIKDSGDDPDVTNGSCIFATVRHAGTSGIHIKAGEGVGVVTKAGLAVEIGEPAINPVPRAMILKEVASRFGEQACIEVTIGVENGKEIATRTMNGNLGIVGGLSILGTSGRVKPMSEEALKDSLHLQLSQLSAEGASSAVFTLGNYGSNFFLKSFDESLKKYVVTTSNFVGFMLEKASFYGFKNILLVGHIGKLVKLAGGIFNTHSKVADARNEILAAHYLHFSDNIALFNKLFEANTTEESVCFIADSTFYTYLAEVIKRKSEIHVRNALQVEVLLFSQQRGELGSSYNFKNAVKKWF